MRITGLDKLDRALKDNVKLDDVKRVVRANGDLLNETMQRETHNAFVKGYSTGDTARSIQTHITDGGMTATVKPTTNYAAYVEYGTRFMSAEPFVKPAFLQVSKSFISDMEKLLK